VARRLARAVRQAEKGKGRGGRLTPDGDERVLQAFVSLLAITNPIVAAPLFLGIVAGCRSTASAAPPAMRASPWFAILAGAASAGRYVLELFGISLDAFRTAGGPCHHPRRASRCCAAARA